MVTTSKLAAAAALVLASASPIEAFSGSSFVPLGRAGLRPSAGHASLQGQGQARRSVVGAAPSLGRRGAAATRQGVSCLGMAVDEVEYVKVFGRLGEKLLFGDGSAGACCHSGCDNCEWRYTFDVMQSARPKWIPTYRVKTFEDGREHIAKWSNIFEEGSEEAIDKEKFVSGLLDLKFDMPLGPSGFLTAKQATPSEEALDEVWDRLSKGKGKLTPKQFSIRLRKMVPPGMDDTGLMWTDFVCSIQEQGEDDDEDELDELEPLIVA